MYIYKITNTINGKIYIGQTIRSVEQRFNRHINDAINCNIDTHFARAIRKYGLDVFFIEIIDTAQSECELTQKEQYWIRYYNSTNPGIGYNETDAIYKCGGNTYKSKTQDEMNLISDKIRQTKYGASNPMASPVKCKNVITGQILHFETVKDCQLYFQEKTHRFITNRVIGNAKILYKNEWQIAYECDDFYELHQIGYKTGIKILAQRINSEEAIEFQSLRALESQLHINRRRVSNYIKQGSTNFQIDNFIITVIE
jgi:group I intron endonuclease